MSVDLHLDSRPVQDVLTRLLAAANDLTPAMDSIGMELESRISERFETTSDPSGQPWAPWQPSTRAAYPDGGNGTVLDRYGDMLASLGHEASADSTTVGFGQPYAAYHEFGTRKMARRGLLFDDPVARTLAPGDEAAVLEILESFIKQAAG